MRDLKAAVVGGKLGHGHIPAHAVISEEGDRPISDVIGAKPVLHFAISGEFDVRNVLLEKWYVLVMGYKIEGLLGRNSLDFDAGDRSVYIAEDERVRMGLKGGVRGAKDEGGERGAKPRLAEKAEYSHCIFYHFAHIFSVQLIFCNVASLVAVTFSYLENCPDTTTSTSSISSFPILSACSLSLSCSDCTV